MTGDPFENPEVVRTYEDWYETPYGQVAESVRVDLLLELLGPLPAEARVLDIGCGTGRFAHCTGDRNWRPVGVDRSRGLLRKAATRLPVFRADADALPWVDSGFDAAVVTFVLEFSDHPQRLLREALRVSRGPVVMVALCDFSYLALRRRLSAARGDPIFRSLRYRSAKRWRDIVRESGAEIQSARRTMFLPPSAAARWPGLERRLSSGNRPLGGLVAYSLKRPRTRR